MVAMVPVKDVVVHVRMPVGDVEAFVDKVVVAVALIQVTNNPLELYEK